MALKTSIPVIFLSLAAVRPHRCQSDRVVVGGAFEVQSYQLPGGQGYRHMTAIIDEGKEELILFGGLGNGPPASPTPMNHDVYALDLTRPPSEQGWEKRSTDAAVERPWFTSTRGFVQVDGAYYLTCDDTDENAVYAFDERTYEFERLGASTLAPQVNAGDCCAVGVKIPRSLGGADGGEVRIYVLGGRNEFQSPVAHVRYYSVTHDRWEQVSDLNVGRSHLGCISVEQRGAPLIYAIGGGNSPAGTALRSIEIYDVLRDEWTLRDDFLPAGRTRLAVQSVEDRHLLLIGGDASCAGGGAGNSCQEDHPLTNVDVIDIHGENRFISGVDHQIPQLRVPRQTPATSLRRKKGNDQEDKYVLYVVGGRTLDGGQLGVSTSTEVLSFGGVRAPN
jgi:hypothetical protein